MDKWLKNNLVAKILALVLAIMLWMVVNLDDVMKSKPIESGQATSLIDKSIEGVGVHLLYDADNFVVSKIEQRVNVNLRGERRILSAPISADNYDVYVDLRGFGAGTHTVPVKYKGFPKGVQVEIRPANISVTLEEKQRKEMQVIPEVTGTPDAGYSIGEPIVNPIKVHVTGSSSQLANLALVKGFINVNGAKDTVKKKVALKVVDVNGNVIDAEVEPAIAEITVPITPPFVSVPLILEIQGKPAKGYAVSEIESSVDTIKLFSTKDKLTGIEFYSLAVDIQGLAQTQSIEIPIPKGDFNTVSPDKVSVKVHIVPSVTKELNGINVQIRGGQDEYETNFVNPSDGVINFVVEGAPNRIAELKIDDFQVHINVADLGPGSYNLPVYLVLPSHVYLVGETPSVSIQIVEKGKPAITSPELDSNTDTDDHD